MSDMEMGYDVSGTQSFKFSIPGWGFMAAEGNCLDAKYTHIFRKYWFLHNLFFFCSPNPKDKSMGCCTEIKGKSWSLFVTYLFFVTYLHKNTAWETPGTPSPKEPANYVGNAQHVDRE